MKIMSNLSDCGSVTINSSKRPKSSGRCTLLLRSSFISGIFIVDARSCVSVPE